MLILQQSLKRKLLWIPCRHHICEVILSHVWDVLNIEPSKARSILIFKKLQDNWYKIDNIDMSILYQATNIAPEGIMEFYRNSLDADFLREDYLELVQLCLMYLDSKANRFSFRKPAAISRARWMAKVIYSLKIVLLSTQIQPISSAIQFYRNLSVLQTSVYWFTYLGG